MREILFRGKRIDNGEWVEGSLITGVFYYIGEGNLIPIPYILSISDIYFDSWKDIDEDYGLYEVDRSTVGQYTGLTDKKGKKIFEGDILEWDIKEWGKRYREVVTWNFQKLAYREYEWHEWCTVIGNIHDNPELLEEEE